MNRFIKNSIQVFFFIFIFSSVSCTHYPPLNEPDLKSFNSRAGNSILMKNLAKGELTDGMPYYVVSQIFSDWPDNLKETKIPVASLGSKQKLTETEGWGRVYSDPDIQIFMDEYKTSRGVLNVWYQFPSFYRMDVSSGDTLVIVLPDTILSSVVSGLRKSNVLTTREPFAGLPNKDLYAEIHYSDHPWRKKTYWFTLRALSDGKTFLLKDLQYQIYPVELLEFNGEPVSSFNWRNINED